MLRPPETAMRMHREQLNDLVRHYSKNTPEGDEALRAGLAAWRRWILKGYAIDIPNLPPLHVEDTEGFDRWARTRFRRVMAG